MGRIDMELWTPFIKQWEEAAAACLSPDEFAELIGVHVNTLRSRQIALRHRGMEDIDSDENEEKEKLDSGLEESDSVGDISSDCGIAKGISFVDSARGDA